MFIRGLHWHMRLRSDRDVQYVVMRGTVSGPVTYCMHPQTHTLSDYVDLLFIISQYFWGTKHQMFLGYHNTINVSLCDTLKYLELCVGK